MTVVAPADGPLLDRCRRAGIETVDRPVSRRDGVARRTGRRWLGFGRTASARPCGSCRRQPSSSPYLRRLRGELRRSESPPSCTATASRPMWRPACVAAGRTARVAPARVRAATAVNRAAPAPLVAVAPPPSSSTPIRSLTTCGRRWGTDTRCAGFTTPSTSHCFAPTAPPWISRGASGFLADDGLVRIGLVATFGRWKGHDVFLRGDCAGSRRNTRFAPTSSAAPCIKPPAASAPSTSSRPVPATLGWTRRRVHRTRRRTFLRRCERSTSSCTRAPIRSRSGW